MGWLSDVLELFDLDPKKADDDRDDPGWMRRDRARLLYEYDRRERAGTLDRFRGQG